jgi:uncharacterized protein YndB with AHSA1/START domain
MQIFTTPVAKAEMQIRKPIAEVFKAFVDPLVTSHFWFTRGSDTLEVGKPITWEWEMYNFSVEVTVKELEPNKRILVDWGAYGNATEIEWIFTKLPDDTTFVSVTNRGFTGDGDNCVKQAIESTEGFAFVLAGAKAWLEHGLALNLVPDRFPKFGEQ